MSVWVLYNIGGSIMKRDILLVEYYDHFWIKMDTQKDWLTQAAERTTLTTIGAIVYEDDVQLALLNDFGSSNEEVMGEIEIHGIVKSCIVRRTFLRTVEVGI
jgi:hypothetical protein